MVSHLESSTVMKYGEGLEHYRAVDVLGTGTTMFSTAMLQFE
jgi:hypothetical protein